MTASSRVGALAEQLVTCAQVLDQYVAPIDTHAYMAMALVPILAMSLVRNLKYLAPISLASNVIMCIGETDQGPRGSGRRSARKYVTLVVTGRRHRRDAV